MACRITKAFLGSLWNKRAHAPQRLTNDLDDILQIYGYVLPTSHSFSKKVDKVTHLKICTSISSVYNFSNAL